MKIQIEQILVLVYVLLWVDVLIILRTLSNKAQLSLGEERRSRELFELARLFEVDTSWDKKKVRRLFTNYHLLKQSIDLPEQEREMILKLAKAETIEPRLIRKLGSKSGNRRMEAAMGLALIGSQNARLALEEALEREGRYPVRLYIANALADIGDPRSIAPIVKSLRGAHRWYRDKVNMLLASYGLKASEYFRGYMWSRDSEIIEMLIDLASVCICGELKDYLLDLLARGEKRLEELELSVKDCPAHSCAYCAHGAPGSSPDARECDIEGKVAASYHCPKFKLLITKTSPAANHRRLMRKAAENLEKYYSSALESDSFIHHPDPNVRAIAIRSLGRNANEKNVRALVALLADEETAGIASIGLSILLGGSSRFIPLVAELFESASEKNVQQRLAQVLSGRIEYFIDKLSGRDKASAARLVREILQSGKVSETVEFLKRNKDQTLQTELLKIVAEEARANIKLREECGLYLPDELLESCGIPRTRHPDAKRRESSDPKQIRTLWVILIASLCLFPLLYLLRHGSELPVVPFVQQLKTFTVEFNFDFGWYSIAVNSTYLILLMFSWFNASSSTHRWNLKTMSLLFKPRMLPSVSIIAPAYNEEKTIIESANSLLNLKYPDYELVIVNDGSKDGTMDTLISYFGLRRADYHFDQRLKTAPIRGIYTNPIFPRLVVVDKTNGGKADSLNAGINIASKEYFCGIDADSLLEPDSLLKVASLTLDWGVETPAMGGNVFPINGCKVDRGKLMEIALPRNNLAKLQTIEYLRAFMCGRLGWAQVNSLLIISGAFGLFRKERVIDIGGYLTTEERFRTNTVGEDMELVVRISRMMRERKQSYRIGYAYMANCWTEVPESLAVLKRQRDRWHRGLIDIMFFHRKLLFNPKYGRMGLFGMPYYLVFETIGPLFELQGYLGLGVAILFGLWSAKLALFLFFSIVFLGIMISMLSVLIAERQVRYFNFRDTLKMLAIAVVENFGPRQIFSMWRVLGFLSAMRGTQGWGKMERKGFAPTGSGTLAKSRTAQSRRKGA